MKKSIIKKITAIATCATMTMPFLTQAVSASAAEPINPYVIEEFSIDMVAASITSTVDVSNSYTWVHQAYSNWCWAASGSVIFRNVFSSGVVQQYIVSDLNGGTLPNVAGSISDLRTVFNNLQINYGTSHTMTSFTGTSTTLSKIKNCIDNSRAVYLTTSPANLTNGHAVVCVGYRRYSDNTYTLKIYDPRPTTSTDGVYWTDTFNTSSHSYNLLSTNSLYNTYGTVTIDEGFYVIL